MGPLSIIMAMTGISYVVIGCVLQNHPPKKINMWLGYRTSRSTSSQRHWDFAQVYSSKKMVQSGAYLILGAVVGHFMRLEEMHAVYLGLAMVLVFSFIPIILTERALHLLDE